MAALYTHRLFGLRGNGMLLVILPSTYSGLTNLLGLGESEWCLSYCL